MSVSVERSDLVSQLKQAQDWGEQQANHWEQKQTELKRTIQQTEQEIARLQKRLVELNAQQTDLETTDALLFNRSVRICTHTTTPAAEAAHSATSGTAALPLREPVSFRPAVE